MSAGKRSMSSGWYALDGKQVQDMVLGLRVKSELPDAMAVLITVAQNRFLLNSLHGEGFLNMRLTDQETQEAVGIDPVQRVFTPCIQSEPCVLELKEDSEFHCAGHHAIFLPALVKGSPLWERVQEGLQLFGVLPDRGVSGAEPVGEVFQGARAAALADREHVPSHHVVPRGSRVEGLRDQLYVVRLVVGDGEQLILDIGNSDIARPKVVDRVGSFGPHL